jgi:hypothetical protein
MIHDDIKLARTLFNIVHRRQELGSIAPTKHCEFPFYSLDTPLHIQLIT